MYNKTKQDNTKKQVDITIFKNQVLQILYIAYSTVLQC